MARKEQYVFSKETRQKRIENCKDCNGAPIVETFSLQGMCGTHCGKCMNVIDWKRDGTQELIAVKETKIIKSGTSKPDIEITTMRIPGDVGTIKFGELKINE